MIHIHPEDSSKTSNKAIVRFIQGFGTPMKVKVVPSTAHFSGSKWQNKVNRVSLASLIASVLVSNEVFILHYDSDLTHDNYENRNISFDYLGKEQNFNKLKALVLDNVKNLAPGCDHELLMKNFIRMVTFVDFESWVFVNKKNLKKYLKNPNSEDQELSKLMKLNVKDLENIQIASISSCFECKNSRKGKDIFNYDLMENYPYDVAVKKLKSIEFFYRQNAKALKLPPHLDKIMFLKQIYQLRDLLTNIIKKK